MSERVLITAGRAVPFCPKYPLKLDCPIPDTPENRADVEAAEVAYFVREAPGRFTRA